MALRAGRVAVPGSTGTCLFCSRTAGARVVIMERSLVLELCHFLSRPRQIRGRHPAGMTKAVCRVETEVGRPNSGGRAVLGGHSAPGLGPDAHLQSLTRSSGIYCPVVIQICVWNLSFKVLN